LQPNKPHYVFLAIDLVCHVPSVNLKIISVKNQIKFVVNVPQSSANFSSKGQRLGLRSVASIPQIWNQNRVQLPPQFWAEVPPNF